MKHKELENFSQLWRKFHEIWREAQRKSTTSQGSAEFSEAKEIVLRRYKALLEILKKTSSESDPIPKILNSPSITSMSDRDQARQQANWVSASILLKDWRKELKGGEKFD